MSCLRYLYLLTYSGGQYILCCVLFSDVYLQGEAIEVYDIGIESIIISDSLQIKK